MLNLYTNKSIPLSLCDWNCVGSIVKMDKNDMFRKSVSGGRTVLVAVVASSLSMILCLVLTLSLFYSTDLCHSVVQPGTPEIFDVEVWEVGGRATVRIDGTEQTILTETREKAGIHHTVTIQDYTKGLQAIKDVRRQQCFVLPVFGRFNEVQKASGQNLTNLESDPMQLELVSTVEPVPNEILLYVAGQHISELCNGVNTFWLFQREGSGRKKRWDFELNATIFGFKISISFRGS